MATASSSDNNDTLEFPRGSTVPFPYPTPYPQQVALMDTLLQCLQQKEEADLREDHPERQEESPRQVVPTTCSKTSSQRRGRRHRAAVMMLESPTGTGKSLSLACSAMAWLKYCEQRDLLHNTAADNNDNNNDTTKRDAVVEVDDWWNAWVPPEVTQKQEDIVKTKDTAKQARHLLEKELDMWRNKIHPSKTMADTTTMTAKNKQQEEKDDEARARQRRDNYVRSAVTTAKLAARSTITGNAMARKRQRKLQQQQQQKVQTKEQDFCVTDYASDPETTHHDHDIEEEEDRDNDNHHHKSRSQQPNNRPTALQLLNGHALDGSLRGGGGDTFAAPTTTTAVANVTPGTGVRKIIYAARTHSQLSQFVGEVRRIPIWGEKVRVVALGGRQLVCGNAALKKAHPTEASLTEACLDLKQPQSKKSPSLSVVGTNKRTKDSAAPKSKSSGGCPLLESKEAVATLGLHILATPSDIEDAARLGVASQTCTYYASRVRRVMCHGCVACTVVARVLLCYVYCCATCTVVLLVAG